jgi:hypothetical protein
MKLNPCGDPGVGYDTGKLLDSVKGHYGEY